jgi:hypothetical protein
MPGLGARRRFPLQERSHSLQVEVLEREQVQDGSPPVTQHVGLIAGEGSRFCAPGAKATLILAEEPCEKAVPVARGELNDDAVAYLAPRNTLCATWLAAGDQEFTCARDQTFGRAAAYIAPTKSIRAKSKNLVRVDAT